MAKQDHHCTDEHMMLYDVDKGLWICRNCIETLLQSQMDRIVERDVSIITGHIMMIFPALIEIEKS